MQVNANIDEADVGRIRPGQHVTFRVDAYPTDDFHGTVSQIRLQPVVVQNVTTYATIIDVPNPQLKLKPGMTANVKVEIAKRTDVLRVPNAALRFRPTPTCSPRSISRCRRKRRVGGVVVVAAGRGGSGWAWRTPAVAAQARAAAATRQTLPTTAADGRTGGRGAERAAARRAAGRAAQAGDAAADGGGSARRAMVERFKAMSPRRAEAVHRAHEGSRARIRPRSSRAAAPRRARRNPRRRRHSVRVHATVRRAAVGARRSTRCSRPLPTVESRGRVWLFVDQPAEAGEPAARHHRRHEHRAAER